MKKIVLVEDNPDVRETTQEILELADYKVATAASGKKGVELAKSEKPDLIICDIMMPDLDGYGVLRILSKNPDTSNVPFIFLTAKSEKSDIRKGMNLGADDYITKPFEEGELLEAIDIRLRKSENLKKVLKTNIAGLNEFLDEASGMQELQELSMERKTKTYRKKEIIYREDDYANYLYFIIRGKVKCMKTDDYGKHFVNDIHQEGTFIGYLTLLEGGEYHETAIAMENTEVAVIPRQDFQALIRKNREVAANFIKMLSGHVQDREKRLLQLAYAPVRERVSDAILRLLAKEDPALARVPLKLTIAREDLASIVGTAKESLVRTLSELKREGLLDTDGQVIEVLNKAGLEKAATGL